ncbi:uncharacterized protein EI97DRAFT_491900 [Westerdykella ornata]|uniref:Uncharacterized protein n=1 Tax=Westerdykella ornata TaxID=318751 RepID=A0A6A6JRY6_WESOR|nr:uncharacterized protein EI97DRAFT_491900 [Westerdykella ornata]KAF2279157.1 hypothetical protein EI97DRAFT_491900 [Westerdykella ornata]
MPAPLAKGIIIAASVVVAVGIALYESPQVRQWVDQSRRKIALALHSLGDEIQPRRPSECSEDYEVRRQDFIRRRRLELIRRAREEGVAVDLDELARIGQDDVEMAARRERRRPTASQKSFDDLVGRDGRLKTDDRIVEKATGTDIPSSGTVRKRGISGFAAGSAAAAGNPFSDDQVLFDQDEEEAPAPKPFTYTESGGSSLNVQVDLPTYQAGELIDLDPLAAIADSQNVQADHSHTGNATQSFYSLQSSNSLSGSAQLGLPTEDERSEIDSVSAGTLTPRSDRSAFTGVSVVGSQADDIAILSQHQDTDHDPFSETFSEAGFTDTGFSEAGFSEVGSQAGVGMTTPSSWTDVGSDDESEWGGPGHNGHVHQ